MNMCKKNYKISWLNEKNIQEVNLRKKGELKGILAHCFIKLSDEYTIELTVYRICKPKLHSYNGEQYN